MAFLFPCEIDYWDTKHPGRRNQAIANTYLLNTNRMVEMVDTDTGVKFRYNNDPEDRRDSPDNIKLVDTTVATLRWWHDNGHPSKFVTLPVYPGTDLHENTVNTTLEWDDIAYIWQTDRDFDDEVCHMVYYPQAWERKEVMINRSLLAVLVYDWLGIWI